MIRAHALLKPDQGLSVPEIADIVGCSEPTVKRVRRRFMDHSWKRAVYDAPKPGRPRAVTIREEQALIALACSRPPEGAAWWTIRLLAQRSGHSFNTVQRVLKEDGLKRGGKKRGVYRCWMMRTN